MIDYANPYDEQVTAETFDLDGYLSRLDPDLLEIPQGRIELTRCDPLLFALLYMPHHITDADGVISFADPHLHWARKARTWMRRTTAPRQNRIAEVAPRDTGKSTWWYGIIPMWAAAHGWARFIAAFSDAAGQAQKHLATFKKELDTNQLLRADFRKLCTAARRESGTTESDSQSLYIASSGFVFGAMGVDSKLLGLKVGTLRPDVLLCDDIEPQESDYSAYQREQRLKTLLQAILPLNERARVVLVGTVTMNGSIIHDVVRTAGGEEPPDWIKDEKIVCTHHKPIVFGLDGRERSTWPVKWPLDYLESIRHTRSYQLNYENDPSGAEGAYWSEDDFVYGMLEGVTRTGLSIDPATTTERKSDFTGLAVVSFVPPRRTTKEQLARQLEESKTVADRRAIRAMAKTGRCVVLDAWEVKMVGEDLRRHVLATLERFPEITYVLVENNQGGDHWYAILHDLPVRVVVKANTIKKEIRAADLLHHYQMGRVTHASKLVKVQRQMTSYPNSDHDDMIDAVGNAVFRHIPPPSEKRPVKVGATVNAYVR